MRTVRLALVMWLDACRASGHIRSSELSNHVTGTGKDGWYDIIEADRIIGPEFLVPCLEMSDEDAQEYVQCGVERRDFRKRPITDKEKWTRVVIARRIGSAHPRSAQDMQFPLVTTGTSSVVDAI